MKKLRFTRPQFADLFETSSERGLCADFVGIFNEVSNPYTDASPREAAKAIIRAAAVAAYSILDPLEQDKTPELIFKETLDFLRTYPETAQSLYEH